MSDFDDDKAEILASREFQELSKEMGREFVEEMVDFILKTVQKNMDQPVTKLINQLNADIMSQLAQVLPPPLIHICRLGYVLPLVEYNMFMWGAFIYRRWLMQAGADIDALEAKATAKGKIEL